MLAGDIYLASFPFGDRAAMKLRPVLLLTGPVGIGTEVLVAYMSSAIPSSLLDSDILIDPSLPEHRQTGLKATSVLRLHKLATIHMTSLKRRFGETSIVAIGRVKEKLAVMLGIRSSVLSRTRTTGHEHNRIETVADLQRELSAHEPDTLIEVMDMERAIDTGEEVLYSLEEVVTTLAIDEIDSEGEAAIVLLEIKRRRRDE